MNALFCSPDMFVGAVMIFAIGSPDAVIDPEVAVTDEQPSMETTILYCNQYISENDYDIVMEPGNISVTPKE